MSQDNVNTIRGLYDAFARGDMPTVLGTLDSQVDWREADNLIYADGNPYIGPDAVLKGVFMRIANDWDGFTVSPHDLFDAGDTVIACGYYSGAYKTTGREIRAQFAHVFTLRDGKVTKFQQYTDTAQVKEAVGGYERATAA